MATDKKGGNFGPGNRGDQNPGKKPGYEAANWKDPKNPGATQSGSQAERNRNLGSDPASNRDKDVRGQAAGRDSRSELAGRDPRNEIGSDRNNPRNEGARGANQNLDTTNTAKRSNFDTEENDLEDENPNRFPNRDL
nr:hypothetical protein [uncultured Flavobacterium sp.]